MSLDEEDKYLKVNLGLQKAMLLLVEQCHKPDYRATLDCSLKALDDLSRRQKSDPQVVVLMTASMKKALTIVLSACFDVSKEKTIAKMQAGFEVMDAALSSEHEERQRRQG